MTWEELETSCAACQKCPLGGTRTNLVFGVGPRDARLIFIGEGPGEQEDLTGVPFVGPAGRLLDDMLALVGLSRAHNAYIANIVKCRPPRNRDPENAEQEACLPWLEAQLSLLRPQMVVCLGRIAATRLIRPDFKISREHGEWSDRDGVMYTAVYHPSALLRDPSKRPETFQDLKSIQQKIRDFCPGIQLLPPLSL